MKIRLFKNLHTMKKFFLLLVILLAGASFSHAQLAKGKYMIGGGFGLDLSNTSWSLTPAAGYFVRDDIGVGLDLNVFDAGAGLVLDLGLAGRKYWSIMDNTYLYGHAGLTLGVAGGGGVRINAYPGVMYFLNERLAIDGRLSGLNGGGLGMSLLF